MFIKEASSMEELKVYQGARRKQEGNSLEHTRKMETGFPSPATDHLEKALDLEELIVRRPAATFYVRAKGDAMEQSGIQDGDILVVDRSINPKDSHLVIAAVNEEPIIRRLIRRADKVLLVSDNNNYEPISIHGDRSWMIWGVITHVIHRCKV